MEKVNTRPLIYMNEMQDMWLFLEHHKDLGQTELAEKFMAEQIITQRDKYMIFYQYLNSENVGVYLSHLMLNPASLRELCLNPDTNRLDALADEVVHVFPDFPVATRVYLMPAFGDIFSAMAFPLGEENVIRLGLDELSGYDELVYRTTVLKELMHVYHYTKSPDYRMVALNFLKKNELPKLCQLIWSECLPVLAVKTLKPSYSDDLLFHSGELIDAAETDKAAIAKLMEYNLDTNSISGFFYFRSENYPKLPIGSGYYLGTLLLADIATRYSLQEMFAFTDELILPEIRKSIKKLL